MNTNYQHIKVIGFDADDTLWINEPYFREAEKHFSELLSRFEIKHTIDKELFKTVVKNLPHYGYGVKGFVLSMIEVALEVSNHSISNKMMAQILNIGKDMLNQPIELLQDVENVLKTLYKDYKLIMVTKGDLLDQERKLEKSGLLEYFHHIEILSDKNEANYSKLLNHLDIKPSEFLMVGNSLKSDVLPLINIKSNAIHIPFHTTWQYELMNADQTVSKTYNTLKCILDLPKLLN